MQTAGELASICDANWSSMFAANGKNVISTVKVNCLYPLPLDKDGIIVQLGQLKMTWSEGSNAEKPALQVASQSACPTDAMAWYPDNATTPTAAVLCQATCDAMTGKTLHFHFGCGS